MYDTLLERSLKVLEVLLQAPAYGYKPATDLKKMPFRGQNCSESSGPEKLLKIVYAEMNKETIETD